jgi:putative ABC transport system substrate-binding protein
MSRALGYPPDPGRNDAFPAWGIPGDDMRRRTFVCGWLAAFAAPLTGEARQPGKLYRIGYLETGDVRPRPWEAFRERLRELGYLEGQTVAYETRWADGQLDRLPTLAAELVRLKVDVLVTAGSPAARAAKSTTTSTPIVMATGGDPVGLGLVASLARPGGNVTGLTTLSRELSGKRLEVLREAFPRVSRFGLLWHRTSAIDALTRRETEEAAHTLGIPLTAQGVDVPDEFDRAFGSLVAAGAGGVLFATSPMFFGHRRHLADLALKHRLPTMFAFREYAEAGGLMAYGPGYTELFQRAAGYVDKILRGAKPGDLPIEQPTKFELIINLKTAKALGLTIPPSLLARTDQVIE